jgi:hypothetical protein
VADFRPDSPRESDEPVVEMPARDAAPTGPHSDGLIRSVQGETQSQSEWRDHGIIEVPVEDLPWPEDIEGPEDLDHHISWADAEAAAKNLPEIQRQVQTGKSADDFSAADLAAGKDPGQGQRAIYDLYYGSQPIELTKDGEVYDIIDGRHRVFAAKHVGLQTIPARVRERRT